MSLFAKAIEQVERVGNESSALFFSGGKDAIATAEVWLTRAVLQKEPRFVYFYFVEGLSFVESILRFYEMRWNVRIERRPCHETLSMQSREKGGRRYSFGDVERMYREETGVQWIISGTKKADSLARRGMLKQFTNGIDEENGRCYPLIDWTDKQVSGYCNIHKLPLPVTYAHGIKRSVWIPDAEMLIWIKGQFPSDYKKIVATFPALEIAVEKRLMGYR